MNNRRFAVSVHILILLQQAQGSYVSSSYLAGSININPVLVRKELINLRKHGFVQAREGKNGGAALAKPAADIRLADVYHAVREKNILGENRTEPNPKCPVGKQINGHLEEVYHSAEQALVRQLESETLASFSKRFT
ncbi:Rrf2 family transcriptional regulator [Pedobacter sp. SYP-B3415]|uniref:RrF2 family transcriptional regulator n=1 Tax=Pedobacter sp. SYP-B3415 TaxID=2496641 RepID=UPI00101E107B|nr:Rrf2 family transcriptional regulator [Pedobacter sp. SYP-B3415]